MPTMLITLKIHPGREAEYDGLQKQLMKDVAELEPGAEVFQVRRSAEDPLRYVFFMSFKDDAAQQRYMDAEYHTTMSPKAFDCIDGEPVMENLVDFR
jgi:quinol monooxygenase YgiN